MARAALFRLDPDIVLTEVRPRRPHQGWRYLKDGDAPPDRGKMAEGADHLPPALMAELRDLGLV